jgi:short-subunit dehydrogenase
MDVTDAAAWERLSDDVERVHGGVDLLVSNAGLTILGAFESQAIEDLDRIVDVNLKGVLYGCRAVVPRLRKRGGGHVVNVSSLAGRVPFPYQTTYCATKYAVRGFTAALRMELAGSGIGVTCVMPGAVATRLLERARSYDAPASAKMAELMLAHGLAPERVAERVVAAIRADEAEVLIGWDARMTTLLQRVTPSLLARSLGSAFAWRAKTTR